jgi:VWFA-related protein
MFFKQLTLPKSQVCKIFLALLLLASLATGAWFLPLPARAQSQQTDSSQSPNSSQNPNQQPAPPEAGGPGNDVGPYAIPKKKDEPPPPPPTSKPKKIEGMPDYSIHVDVPVVNVDVGVLTKSGQFVPGLKKENFRIYEDGQLQTISNFNQQEAPITAVLLVEFASTNYYYLYDALNASYTFASTLKKDDWIAVVSYDMKQYILVDFTQDKRAVLGAINTLRIPGFSETNLFDAIYDTLDRIDRIEGHKYVILVSSGRDTFSKINLDQCLKKIKATSNVTIYTVSIGRTLREMADARGMVGGIQQTDFLQADNQMNTFAKMTGGRWYNPRFEAEMPEIFHDIGADIRNQYNIAYHPSNPKLDGTYRKLKVEVVAPDGSPLKIKDQKGHDVKYQIVAREGYTAKHQVE